MKKDQSILPKKKKPNTGTKISSRAAIQNEVTVSLIRCCYEVNVSLIKYCSKVTVSWIRHCFGVTVSLIRHCFSSDVTA